MTEYEKLLDSNTNLQFIVGGLAGLIEEGYKLDEVAKLLEDTKRNIFPALREMEGNIFD